jgi:regulator of replication initiation timing
LNYSTSFFVFSRQVLVFCLLTTCLGIAQQASPAADNARDQSLAQSVEELREQVQELRAAVAEMKSEATEYRAQSEELRKELEKLRTPAASGTAPPTAAPPSQGTNASIEQRLSTAEENSELLASEVRTQYQTKVESASKYRVRLSGMVLMNLFRNDGFVDNLDFPTYASGPNGYDERNTFGATLRQSELGLEVFGPQIAGAKSSGRVEVDFGGGFPVNQLNGVNTGIVRMRTASMRLDWENTSVIAGQDSLFISPLSPTSFASLDIPAFGYSGNLWAWTPQLRIQHRFNLSPDEMISVDAGILDNVTGEPSPTGSRLPSAGENTAQPAYAARTGWRHMIHGRPLSVGASGYVSRQHYGPTWDVTGWAAASDWQVPLFSKLEVSGELYRGLAVGGIGGGIGQSVLFSANPINPAVAFRPLNSAGGWSQLKVLATPKLEFNGAFGLDNPFSSDIHAVPYPISYYPHLLTSNWGELVNVIFRPRSDLLLSGEYRHLQTSQIRATNDADQVNVVMGVLF